MSVRLFLAYLCMGISMMGFYFGSELQFPGFRHFLVLVPALMAFALTIKRFTTRHVFFIISMVIFLGVASLAFVFSFFHWPGALLFRLFQIPFLGLVILAFILWALKQNIQPVFFVHVFLMFGFVLIIANNLFDLGLSTPVWAVSLLSFVATLWHLNDFNRWEQQKNSEKEEINL